MRRETSGCWRMLLQRRELRPTEVAGGNERRPRDRARQADEGDRASKPDARKAPRGRFERERRQVARHEPVEVKRKPPLPMDRGEVDVVIARHDRDLRRPRGVDEQPDRLLVLALERQVRDVSGDDEVVGRGRGGGQHRQQVVAPIHARAGHQEVRVARDALVEENAPQLDSGLLPRHGGPRRGAICSAISSSRSTRHHPTSLPRPRSLLLRLRRSLPLRRSLLRPSRTLCPPDETAATRARRTSRG